MDISYRSKLFSLKHCAEYKLSIQASLDGFSFCVFDFKRNTYRLLKHFTIDVNGNLDYFIRRLGEIINSEEIFSQNFIQVNFLYLTPNTTIIIEELSNEIELKNYLGFQHETNEYDELHYDLLKQHNSRVVYSVPSDIPNLFLRRFKNVNYFNQYTILIRLAQDILVRNSLSEVCLIHKSRKFFDIVIYKNKRLELCNTFNYTTGNDLIYYFISTLKKLKLSDSDIPVYYSGIPETGNNDVLTLSKFVKVLKMNEPNQINKENSIALFNDYPVYYFSPLYFLNYCV